MAHTPPYSPNHSRPMPRTPDFNTLRQPMYYSPTAFQTLTAPIPNGNALACAHEEFLLLGSPSTGLFMPQQRTPTHGQQVASDATTPYKAATCHAYEYTQSALYNNPLLKVGNCVLCSFSSVYRLHYSRRITIKCPRCDGHISLCALVLCRHSGVICGSIFNV